MLARLVASLVVGVLLSSGTGCIPLAFVFPRATYIPAPVIDPEEAPALAFRIEDTFDFEAGGFMCGWIKLFPTKRTITLLTDGEKGCPGQVCLSLERGLFWYAIYTRTQRHAMSVKLYRPGYGAVELAAWPSRDPIVWREIIDTPSRMATLDSIWTDPEADESDCKRVEFTANSGPALLAIASEYDRMAGDVGRRGGEAHLAGQDVTALVAQLRKRCVHLRTIAGPIEKSAGDR